MEFRVKEVDVSHLTGVVPPGGTRRRTAREKARLSVDKSQSELESDLLRGEAVLLRNTGRFGTAAHKEITLGFQDYCLHIHLLVQYISSHDRTISSGSLLPVVSMI
jgi:hypothetical protein